MGRVFLVHPEGKTWNCKFCDAKLGHVGSLVTKALRCSSGRAYLFNEVVNITFGEAEERTLLSGTHTVMDIFCVRCGQIVGWKYVKSHEESQKYKEGKFVLEGIRIVEGEFDSEFYIDTRSSSSDDEDGDTV
ncbi:protein yippee-like At5g53940 isoform X1 [Solanum pennellii]|uniref:Protein yippee-like n=1 Tax=Solanum pennellii TaxID=28526 RepID=A0ABM1H827_SOLPN|nr:protein yippee-like At5g53940 isoform X1 [Solanum pennellii]XP_015081765.1 protein yippee-like At5g53940 isoform X1 [Solanum pennellii]XP_027774126.1 protein yippee-like At5g53940 isoform X1 [Solanum pennellii]